MNLSSYSTLYSVLLVFILLSNIMLSRCFPHRVMKSSNTIVSNRSHCFARSLIRSLTSNADGVCLPSDYKKVETNAKKAKIMFVLGGPGAGKGTQCDLLAKTLNIKHLSAGELLRQAQRSNTPEGELINQYLQNGRIVPVEISLNLLKQEILQNPFEYYLIDGFPRNVDNWEGWQHHMPSIASIELILYIHCTQAKLSERILQRGLTSNRNDDNLITLNKRFTTFRNDSWPIIQYFQAHSQQNATGEIMHKKKTTGTAAASEAAEEAAEAVGGGFYTLPSTQPGQPAHIASYQPAIPTPSLRLPYAEISGDGSIQETYEAVKSIVYSRLQETVQHWNEDITNFFWHSHFIFTTVRDTVHSLSEMFPAFTSTELLVLEEEWKKIRRQQELYGKLYFEDQSFEFVEKMTKTKMDSAGGGEEVEGGVEEEERTSLHAMYTCNITYENEFNKVSKIQLQREWSFVAGQWRVISSSWNKPTMYCIM